MNRYLKKSVSTFFLIILFSLLLATPVFAVSEAAVLFLLISPSPQANAMGETYGNIASTSPMAVIFNPASLGLFAQENYFGISYYPRKTDWLPALVSDMNYNAKNTSFGINLKHGFNIPVSLGFAAHWIKFDMGESFYTDETGQTLGTFRSWEEEKGSTFSIAVDYYIKASFGYTRKTIKSHLAPMGVGAEQSSREAKANAHDIGFILEFPVHDLLRKFQVVPNLAIHHFEPFFNPGFYYSKTNIGDKITYIDALQADPLPRNLSLGINLNTGVTYKGKYHDLNIVSFKWAREVDDILIKINRDYSKEYASGLHDIQFWDNLILGKANDKIISKKGYEFDIGDFYFIRKGRYEDIEGRVIFKTEGWGINYTQPLKILAELFDFKNDLIVKLISSINFEKHYAKYITDYGHPLYGTEFTSYVIRLNNFPINNIF
jgi:hypothetical protein